MNSRINKIFSNKEKKLVTFVTGGDPNLETSIKIINTIAKSGADIIEIGMPFSDPMADGPTIQLSSKRAIEQNINLDQIFFICQDFRMNNNDIPLKITIRMNKNLKHSNSYMITTINEDPLKYWNYETNSLDEEKIGQIDATD